jgi:hypothetical protein
VQKQHCFAPNCKDLGEEFLVTTSIPYLSNALEAPLDLLGSITQEAKIVFYLFLLDLIRI